MAEGGGVRITVDCWRSPAHGFYDKTYIATWNIPACSLTSLHDRLAKVGLQACGNGEPTAPKVKAVKGPGRYQDGDGLILVVRQSVASSWLLRVQVGGRRGDFGLGRYPKYRLKGRERRRKLANTFGMALIRLLQSGPPRWPFRLHHLLETSTMVHPERGVAGTIQCIWPSLTNLAAVIDWSKAIIRYPEGLSITTTNRTSLAEAEANERLEYNADPKNIGKRVKFGACVMQSHSQ